MTCAAPTSAGVNLCSPAAGSTVSSPVQVEAATTVTGTIASTQLWLDGVEKYSSVGTTVLNTSISLPAGSHRFAVLALNTAGQKWETAVNATVGTTTGGGGGGGCSVPSSPGVNLCTPASGSSVTSPVQVQAAAAVSGTISSTQLWVDGVKVYGAPSSNMLNTSVTLPAGTHRFAVLALNTAGQKWETAVNATVQ